MNAARAVENEARVVILLGPPGSGKGTQSALLKDTLGIPAISTGEILRAESASPTPQGRRLAKRLAQGSLARDEVVNGLIARRLAAADCRRGFILDGYPRTLAQADFLRGLLLMLRLPEPVILHFSAPHETLVRRLSGRRQCGACGRIYNAYFHPPRSPDVCDADGAPLSQRPDDRESVVEDRLAIYERTTRPLVDYYRNGCFHSIDADAGQTAVREALERALCGVALQLQ